jgi:hypothetical protein
LNRSVDEGVLGDSKDQTETVNRQITDLGKRWDYLKQRVKTKLYDNKKTAERRQSFERKYSSLYELLVSIEMEEGAWKNEYNTNLKQEYSIAVSTR